MNHLILIFCAKLATLSRLYPIPDSFHGASLVIREWVNLENAKEAKTLLSNSPYKSLIGGGFPFALCSFAYDVLAMLPLCGTRPLPVYGSRRVRMISRGISKSPPVIPPGAKSRLFRGISTCGFAKLLPGSGSRIVLLYVFVLGNSPGERLLPLVICGVWLQNVGAVFLRANFDW